MKKFLSKYIPAPLGRIFNSGIIFIAILTTFASVFAGSRVTGFVRNIDGDPVPDVNISIVGTAYGSVSDTSGKYSLPRLPDGDYTIIFRHVCCMSEDVLIHSGTEDIIYLDVSMRGRTLELDPIYAEAVKEDRPDITISTREIETSGSKTAQEAILNIPGVNVENVDGNRTRVSVRGTDSKHTSVYIDGVLINSPMDGSFDLASIPSVIIEKIEIYKTGENTLSSRSVGGIISITTRKNSGQNEIYATYGNTIFNSDRDTFSPEGFNNHDYGCGFMRKLGEHHGIFLSFSGKRNENEWSYINASKFDEYRYINNPNTAFIQTNSYSYSDDIYASYSYTSESFEGSAGINLSKHKNGIPGWYDQPYYDAFSSKTGLILTGYAVLNSDFMQYRFDVSFSDREDITKIEEVNSLYYIDSKNRFDNYTLKFQTRYDLKGIVLRGGSEYFNESVRSDYLSESNKERDILSVFVRSEYKKNITEMFTTNVSGGLRKDIISESDFNRYLMSGSFSQALKNSIAKLNWSYSYDQSYNLPSFSDLFWAENLFSSGNVSLKPEFCIQHEASLSTIIEKGSYRLSSSYSYYHKELEDLIVWIKRNNGKYTPENFKKGIIQGHEISAALEYNDNLSMKVSYDRLNARQFTDSPVTNDKYIIYKPVETLSISLSGNYNEWHAELRAKYNGRMYLNESNSIDTYPYTLYGANLSKKLKAGKSEITFNIGAENLTDEQYQVIYGYPMPGRKIETGIKIKF